MFTFLLITFASGKAGYHTMTDLQAYIQSGIIEAYCLGQLDATQMFDVERMAERYADIRAEIARTDATLHHLATETPILRARRENILHTLQQLQLEQQMSLHNLPLLTPYSDHRQWLAVVGALQPTDRVDGIEFCVLRHQPNLTQTLIWMKDSLEEDGHDPDDFQESMLVLEGECECNLGGEIIRLSAGGYLKIPAYTPHTIRNLHPSRPLIGIMQRSRAAA